MKNVSILCSDIYIYIERERERESNMNRNNAKIYLSVINFFKEVNTIQGIKEFISIHTFSTPCHSFESLGR